MALNVKFLKGTHAQFNALATKDVNTFYYIDEKDLYLGSIKVTNGADLEAAKERISANEEDIEQLDRLINGYDGEDGNHVPGILEDLGAAETTIGQHETKINGLDDQINGENGLAAKLENLIKSEGGVIAGLEGRIEDLEEAVKNIQENAYDDTALKTEIQGKLDLKADKTQVATDIENAVNAEKSARETAVAGVQSAVDTLAGTHATDKAALEAAIALKADKTALEAEVERATGVEEDFEERISNMETFWKTTEDATEVVDTLKEIQEYITNDKTGAAGMLESIQQNATAIGNLEKADEAQDAKIKALEDKFGEGEGSVADMIKDAVDVVAGDLSDFETEVARDYATKQALADEVTNRQKAIDDAIAALDANVSSAEPEAGKGVKVSVVEVDGKITEVSVSGNYDNAYDAKGAAATAKSEAVAAAATDAQGKADAALASAKTYADQAEADAISAAATDATSKANKALSDAKAYADTAEADAVATAKAYTDQAEVDAINAAKAYTDTALTWGTL